MSGSKCFYNTGLAFINFVGQMLTLHILFYMVIPGISWAQSPLTRFSYSSHGKELVISWTLATGKTCNGIRILRSNKPTEGFLEIGYLGGICGSIDDTVSYDFIDSSPQLNQNQFYALDLSELGFSDTLMAFVSYAPETLAIFQWYSDRQQYKVHINQQFSPPIYLRILGLDVKEIANYRSDEAPFWFDILDIPVGLYLVQIIDSKGLTTQPQYFYGGLTR
jgi:hypothetical protein